MQELFGIELEYFLLGQDGYPALQSGQKLLNAWQLHDSWPVPFTLELGSFQVELNPGPWPLTPDGLEDAIQQTEALERILFRMAQKFEYECVPSAFVPNITEDILNHPNFFTDGLRYRASSNHFSKNHSTFKFANGEKFVFEGEKAVACLNEIHIHIQFATTDKTISFFNYLNHKKEALINQFSSPPILNGARAEIDCTVSSLFEQSGNELDSSGRIKRVSWFPFTISSPEEYWKIVNQFKPIKIDGTKGCFLDSESTAYFWARLRSDPNLRVEYRPMEMSPNWQERVTFLAETAMSFE